MQITCMLPTESSPLLGAGRQQNQLRANRQAQLSSHLQVKHSSAQAATSHKTLSMLNPNGLYIYIYIQLVPLSC